MAIRLITRPGILLLLALLAGGMLRSQVVIIPEVPTGGMVLKQQLWSVVINNLSGQPKKAILAISIVDRHTSQRLLEATSNILLLPAGVKRAVYNDLLPVNYSITTEGFGMERIQQQSLPVGEYLVCYRLAGMEGKSEILATECVKVIAEPLSPPQLVQPQDGSVILEPRPVLTWTPPAPLYMFNSLSYDIIVSQLYEKQSPQEALQRNIPVMTLSAVNNSVMYAASFTNLEAGKTYVWQVAAKEANRYAGKSEVWKFTVAPDSVKAIIDNAAFIKIQQAQSEVVYLHQGTLKIDYTNMLADSVVKASIEDLTQPAARPIQFDIALTRGQNMIQRDINRLGRLKQDHVYKLTITNSRKETVYVRFVPQYYF